MPLVDMRDLLGHAYRNRYAVGAFDLVSLDFLGGILAAAGRCQAPVILSLAESHFEYFDFDTTMPAVEAAARRAPVPVAIHLDHGASLASVVRGIRLGCNGVMVDASSEPFEGNVERTAEVVRTARGCGVAVEGELGYVAGVEGEDAEKHPGEVVYTSVSEAGAYVKRTGVDCLAVSIGTVHGRMKGLPRLDLERLAEIDAALGIPLVIHGGTGLSDEQFRGLIARGVTKINYYTALADAAGARIRESAGADARGGYTALVHGVAEAIARECERCIRLWGGAGRAVEVLAECRPWQPVEHVVSYCTGGVADAEVERVVAEGRRVLSGIPGVRRVRTGTAINPDARYSRAWLVELAHPSVVATYRDHPGHVAFAGGLFRPIAPDRVTVDYWIDEGLAAVEVGAGPGDEPGGSPAD
jgi:fructose-bisphosphate aldolase class II